MSDESVQAVVDSEGPWPSPSPLSTGTCTPFDVDRYDGLAVVVGHGRNRKGREVLGFDEFQRGRAGTWEHLGGGGSSGSLPQRWDMPEGRDALHFRISGSSGTSIFDDRRPFSFVVLRCGPAVMTVEVARQQGVRVADVSAGPGWLTALWTPGDPVTVTAFSATGEQTSRWTPPTEGS